MRDRLRAVTCPSEMVDQISGWSSGKVGEGYGDGFDLRSTAKALFQIIHNGPVRQEEID